MPARVTGWNACPTNPALQVTGGVAPPRRTTDARALQFATLIRSAMGIFFARLQTLSGDHIKALPEPIVMLRCIEVAMGISKAEEFSLRDNRLAGYAKAMAHPARIAILRLLVSRKACVCGDIVGELPLSQSTVSQHLKELKAAGLIQGSIEGAKICYCLNPDGWIAAQELLSNFFSANEMSEANVKKVANELNVANQPNATTCC